MNPKRKGSAGERELRAILLEAGYNVHRNEQRYVGGVDNPDIGGLPGFHVECKRCERLNVYDAYEQALRDANGHAVPVVMHRRSRKPWLAIIGLKDFLKLIGGNEHGV